MRIKIIILLSIFMFIFMGCTNNDPISIKLDMEPLYTSDSRWIEVPINSDLYDQTVIDRGSALLSFVMVTNYLNKTNITPLAMGKDYYYLYFDWNRAAEENQLSFKSYGGISYYDSFDSFKRYIDNGYPIILYLVNYDNFDRKYVIINGYTNDESIMIIDPTDSSINSLSELTNNEYNLLNYIVLEPNSKSLEYLDDNDAYKLIRSLNGTWVYYEDGKYATQYITFAIDANNDLRIESASYETEYNYPEYFYIERIIKVDDFNYTIDASHHEVIVDKNTIKYTYPNEFLTININIENLENGIIATQFGYNPGWNSNSVLDYQLTND